MNSDLLYVFSVMTLLNITEQAVYAAKERRRKKKNQNQKTHTKQTKKTTSKTNTNAPHDQDNVLS